MKYESALSAAQPVVHRWAIMHFHRSVPLTGEKEEETETDRKSSDTHTWLSKVAEFFLRLRFSGSKSYLT